jgi:hypothetical protein
MHPPDLAPMHPLGETIRIGLFSSNILEQARIEARLGSRNGDVVL